MPPDLAQRPPTPGPLFLALLAAAYVAVALLGLQLAVPGTNATVIWLPTGLAMAAALRWGPRVGPGVFLGALAANALVLSSLGLPFPRMAGAALVTALGNTAEALLAGALIHRVLGVREPFRTGTQALGFLLFGAILSPGLSALLGTSAFCTATGQWAALPAMAVTWWLGDAVGALLVVPLLLTFSREELRGLPWAKHREALVGVLLLLALWFGVCLRVPASAFLLLPLLVLAAVRLGSFYAAALVALLALLSTAATLAGSGPFVLGEPQQASLLLQQGFLCVMASTTTVLAGAVRERKALESQLVARTRLHQTLSAVNQAILHAENRQAMFQATCRLLVEVGGFRMAWIGLKQEASGRVHPVASAGATGNFLEQMVVRWDEGPEAQRPAGIAIRENRGVVVEDCQTDPGFAPWREAALAQGYRTCCAFPIRRSGGVVGTVMVYHADPRAIGSEEGALLEDLATHLGYALAALETRENLRESTRRIQTTLENVELLAVTLNPDATIEFCNDFLLQQTGWTRAEVLGRNWFEVFLPPEVRPAVEAVFAAALQAGVIPMHYENEILTRTGARRLIRWNNTLLRDGEGRAIGTVSLGEDITAQKRSESLLHGQKEILEQAAAGAPLAETLAALIRLIEAHAPGMLGSILLLDEDGIHVRHGAAPSLPAAFMAMVDGQPIGPRAGSCGTAAFRKEPVHVADIATDPLWTDYKAAALPHGLRACWSTPIFDAQRRVLGLFAMYFRQPGLPRAEHLQLIDIATHTAAITLGAHRADAALRASEARTRSVFEQANDGIFILSADNRYLDANARGLELLGYAREELLGLGVADVLAPEEVARLTVDRPRMMSGVPHLAEWEHVRKDGSTFPGEVSARRLDDQSYMAILRDLSERRAAERSLRASAEQLKFVTDHAPVAIAHCGQDRRYKFVNRSYADMLGKPPRELVGRHPREILGEAAYAHAEPYMSAALKGEVVQYDLTLEPTPGHPRTMQVKYVPERTPGGGVAGFVAAILDITARTEAQAKVRGLHDELQRHAAELEHRVAERTAALAEARDRAEAADRAKSAFLAAMSHELRTPLNSVIGFTGVMLQGLVGPLTPAQQEPLRIVQRNGRHLLDLINDILDLSKIQADGLKLSALPFDLTQTLAEALESMAPAAKVKGLELHRASEVPTLPLTGDRRRVGQILLNLLSNAVKFTEAGSVTLSLRVRGDRALVAVTDTGPGIAAADFPRLFREFEQLDAGLARQREGTGLGLALSRQLARLMGGDILVESTPGHGSTFTLVLPLAGLEPGR